MNASAASAADPYLPSDTTYPGWYVSISGGWAYSDDDKIEIPGLPVSAHVFFDDGETGSVALGSNFGNGFRAEVEGAIHHNELDHLKLSAGGLSQKIGLHGDLNIYTGLAKIAYDFGDGPIRPFVAAGIGIALFEVALDGLDSDSDIALAGAVEAGITYAVSAHADVFTFGQMLLLDDAKLKPDPSLTSDVTFMNPLLVSASVGLRWKF
jgi:hypothetical protein